ncbi:hypothetical protein [Pseudopedobacter sp.]|uniref:hypothetical protein n=1 Tax=Pseudopedobacter sp. TaxID=1936787 RepID=UPI00333FC92C
MNINNILNYSLIVMAVSLFIACSKDKDPVVSNELEGLQLVTTISNDAHQIELYTSNGKFQTGYNKIYFQIKNANGSLVNNTAATWAPLMHMTSMSHSCPFSSITKKENAQSTFTGYIVFQMAGNDTEYWELALNYTINGKEYTAKDKIMVTAAPKRVVESFQGSDNKRYVVALAEPSNPRVAVNDMKAVLYRMESMTNFVMVDNYKIKIDPRMPGMGNHSSPNNVDLTQGQDKMYQGKLSLTMTGYWKINLQIEDSSQNIIKGEAVTPTNEGSSIYFELEF